MERRSASPVPVELLDLNDGEIDNKNEKKATQKIGQGTYQVIEPGGEIFYQGFHAEMGPVFYPQAGTQECQENGQVPSQFLGPAESKMKAVPEHHLDEDEDGQTQKGKPQHQLFNIVQDTSCFGHARTG